MDLKQLEYFVTVINEGTISSAARKLNLSQPPLSAQMKSLEQEIGSQLFFVHFMSNFLKFVLNYMKMTLIVSSNNYNPKFWILQLYVPLSNQII